MIADYYELIWISFYLFMDYDIFVYLSNTQCYIFFSRVLFFAYNDCQVNISNNYVSILVISYLFIDYDIYESYSLHPMLYMHNWNIISSILKTNKILLTTMLEFMETYNSTIIIVYNVFIDIIEYQILLIS